MDALMELSTWITAALSTLVLGGLKLLLGVKDKSVEIALGKVQEADGFVANLLKSIQPIFVGALTVLIGIVGGHITASPVPTESAVAAAPVSTALAIILRELWARFVKPKLPTTS